MRPIVRSKLIWTAIHQVPGEFQTFQLRSALVAELKNWLITGVETVSSDVLAVTPDGTPVIPITEMPKVTLTLVSNSAKVHEEVPLLLWYSPGLGGIWKELAPLPVDWESSYFRWTEAGGAGKWPLAVPLYVHGIDVSDAEYRAAAAKFARPL